MNLPRTHDDPNDGVQRKDLVTVRILFLLYFSAFGIFVTYIDIYFRTLGFTGLQIGWVNSILALVAIAAGPLWGMLSDSHGSARPYIMVTVAGAAGLAYIISRVSTFPQVLLAAAGFAFFRQPVLTLLDSTTMKILKRQPEMYGRQRAWGTVGFLLSTWGFGFLLASAGLNWMFSGYIALLLLMLFVIPRLPGISVRPARPIWSSVGSAVRRREWLMFSLSIVLLGMGNWASQHFLGIHIKELGADESIVGTAAAISALAELPVLFWGAPLLRRFGPRRLLLLAYTVSALRLFLYGIMPSPFWAIPIGLLHSITFGLYWVAGVSYVDQLAPAGLKATSQGLLYAAMGVAGVLGGPLSGFLFDTVGASRLFITSSSIVLAAGLILWLGRPTGAAIHIRS